MRWSYKTVHYAMKKEGLLGDAFLDESEMELSLNEYGKAGWELVAMFETLDGLTAVFKQPLSLGGSSMALPDPDQEVVPPRPLTATQPKVTPLRVEDKKVREEVAQEVVVIDEYEDVGDEPAVEARKRTPPDSSDVGSIRIE